MDSSTSSDSDCSFSDFMSIDLHNPATSGIANRLNWEEAFDVGTSESDGVEEMFHEQMEFDEIYQTVENSTHNDSQFLNDPEVNSLLDVVTEFYHSNGIPSHMSPSRDNPLPSTADYHGTIDDSLPSTSGYQGGVNNTVPSTSGLQRNEVQDVNQTGGGKDDFTITLKKTVDRTKFMAKERIFEIKIRDVEGRQWIDNLQLLGRSIDECLSRATESLHENDRLRVYINQRGLQNPILVPLQKKSQVTLETVLKAIEKVLQSKSSLKFDSSFEMTIASVSIPRGEGGNTINLEKKLLNKRSVIVIQNRDKLCLARSVVVAMSVKFNDKDRGRIRDSRCRLQTQKAIDLCRKAGVTPSEGCDLEDVKKIETCLNVQIAIVSSSDLDKFLYKGEDRLTKLYLYFHNNHFDVITNMKGFCKAVYYCERCDVGYSKKHYHRCDNICDTCYHTDCFKTHPRVCDDCNRSFRNTQCFDRHVKKQVSCIGKIGQSLCEIFVKCPDCYCVIDCRKRNYDEHECGERFCHLCYKHHTDTNHICYIKPKQVTQPDHNYIFFDFESMVIDNLHTPNFLVAQQTCSKCIDTPIVNGDECEGCGKREFMCKGPDTASEFCKWLFTPEHKNYTAIAHNAKGYDSVFLLKYLLDNAITPNTTFNGNKIMNLHVKELNIRVIDSLNFIPSALSKFPKTFGLTELKKGYFPHFFNLPENQNYKGPFPHVSYYGADNMSTSSREEFLEWHKQQRGKLFDFSLEMENYCRSDVDILRRSCLEFRKLIIGVTTPSPSAIDEEEPWGVDPFKFVTIAGLCFGIFKHMFLEYCQIARVPSTGITNIDQYSKVSIQWLTWLEKKARLSGDPIKIQHALNGGEVQMGNYRLDGFDEDNNVVYEFSGCYVKGCCMDGGCYDKDMYNSKLGLSMWQILQKTKEKEEYFKSRGYTYVHMWDHEFQQEIRTNPALKNFIESLDIVKRLDPRDAFTGGRVDGYRLQYEAKENEQIKYIDITSLYPWCNKYRSVPTKTPIVITKNFKDISNYDGFVKAKILPPKGLLIPVLPYKTDKLLFPLCRTCCTYNIAKCNHTDEERCLTGTWVTPELKLALQKNYAIIQIYEVYHFPNMREYNGVDKDSGLFSEYVDTFLSVKQTSSGFPAHVSSDTDKDKYIDDYFKREGIQLDKNSISHNPGMRTVAKLLLNSFWGKWGQRHDVGKTQFVTNTSDFFAYLVDREKEVTNIHLFSEDVLIIEWKYAGGAIETAASSNVWIAAFTTSWARVKLYEALDKLGDRVLYTDTDSIFYISRPGEYDPPLGDYLGDYTNELNEDEYIRFWGCAGCKNYIYSTNKNREVSCVRGFTLNYINSQKINFPTVWSMVNHFISPKCPKGCVCAKCTSLEKVSVTNEHKITINKHQVKVINKKETKDYRVVFTKRVVQPDFSTLPFGY